MDGSNREHENITDSRPTMEPLTPEEKEAFLARARSQGRTLTTAEKAAIFDAPPKTEKLSSLPEALPDEETIWLDENQLAQLRVNFFPELGDLNNAPQPPLVRGVIFDFDYTLAYLTRPIDPLLEEGAKAAEAYMRSTGMQLPEQFWKNIVEARRFAEEKSEEEQEEHVADDAMSFLLQFFGYPASKMEPEVLRRAVDIFYAPEMVAWRLNPGALEVVQKLHAMGYKLALLANYNCDRVFQRVVDYLGLRPSLDVCVTSAAMEYRKPDAKFFQPLLERWDALPYEVVVVGDSLAHDTKGGIDLGALTVYARLGRATPQVEHDNARLADRIVPDAVIETLSQLPALIHEWTFP